MSSFYLFIPRLTIGVVTISLALHKQRHAQRMSSSFLSRLRDSGRGRPPPLQLSAKVM